MKQLLKKIANNEQAAALIEFAIVFPVMFVLLFAGIETTRYILIVQKVEKTAYVLTNIVSQYSTATSAGGSGQITDAQLTTVFNQFYEMMQPFSSGSPAAVTNGMVSFDSVIHIAGDGKNLIRWERRRTVDCSACGGMTPSIVNGGVVISSTINHNPPAPPGTTPCTVANFSTSVPSPTSYSSMISGMLDHENFIVGQVYFKYTPILTHYLHLTIPGLTSHMVTRAIFIHPRNGDLLDADPIYVATGAPGSVQEKCNNE